MTSSGEQVRQLVVAAAQMGPTNESVDRLEQVIVQFGGSSDPFVREEVSQALVGRALSLSLLDRYTEAVTAYDQLARFHDHGDQHRKAEALLSKAQLLHSPLDQTDAAVGVCDEIVRLFADRPLPAPYDVVAAALIYKGDLLQELSRQKEALAAYSEVKARFDTKPLTLNGKTLTLPPELLARALVKKGELLDELGRPDEALEAYEEIERRFS